MVATGAIIGGTMAATGTGISLGALGIGGTKPGQQWYGGSQDAYNQLNKQYLQGIGSGQGQINSGVGTMGQGVDQAADISRQGQGLMGLGQRYGAQGDLSYTSATDAANNMAGAYGGVGDLGASYYQQAADQNARQQMAQAASARGGNQASAMRTAQATGAQNALQAGQQAAQFSAQGRLAVAQGQANAYGQQAGTLAGIGNAQQQAAQQYGGMGLGAQQYGADASMGAGQALMGLGAGREQMYVGAAQNMYGQQLDTNTQIAMARAAAQQNKQARLFGLGGSLIGSGGAVGSMGMGRGK